MAVVRHTILSAGLVINAILSADEDIRSLISEDPVHNNYDPDPDVIVFGDDEEESSAEINTPRLRLYPVISQLEDRFPCVVYSRVGAESGPVKVGTPPRSVQMSVQVYSRDYTESVVLAELVLAALDNRTYDDGTIRMYSCRMTDSSEAAFETGIYMQELIFDIKI